MPKEPIELRISVAGERHDFVTDGDGNWKKICTERELPTAISADSTPVTSRDVISVLNAAVMLPAFLARENVD